MENNDEYKGKVLITDQLIHKISLLLADKLERLEERIVNLEVLLTSKDEIEKESIKIMIETILSNTKEQLNLGVINNE